MTVTNGNEVHYKIRIKISSQFLAAVQIRIPFYAIFYAPSMGNHISTLRYNVRLSYLKIDRS
jgi:hypothetical protein